MDPVDLKAISFKAAKRLSGSISKTRAEIIVMHSMECPPKKGKALQQATLLAGDGEFFADFYTDPETIIQVAELGRTVLHVGNGNAVRGIWTLGIEQAGNSADLKNPAGKVVKKAMTCQEWIDAGTLDTAGPLVAALIAAGHAAPCGCHRKTSRSPACAASRRTTACASPSAGRRTRTPAMLTPTTSCSSTSHSAPAKEPGMALAQHVDGHLEMFKVANGALVENWQKGSRSAKWSGWQILDKSLTYVEVVGATTGLDGNVNVLAETKQGHVAWWFDHLVGKWNGPAPAG